MRYILVLVSFLVLTSCGRSFETILGQENIEIEEKIYSKDTENITNGEGYLFEIYQLSKKSIDRFIKDKNKIEYPKRTNYVDNIVHWSKPPVLNDDILELVFSNYTTDPIEKQQLSSLKKAIENVSNYYAFGHSETDGYIYRVQFYLIEVNTGRLFIFENEV